MMNRLKRLCYMTGNPGVFLSYFIGSAFYDQRPGFALSAKRLPIAQARTP